MNNAWDYSLDTFIEGLSSRPRNALKSEFRSFHNEYSQAYMKPPHTLRHLLMYTKGELMRIPNLGKHSIQEIDDALAEHGLHLYEKHTQKSLAPLLDYQPKTEPIGWLRAVDEEMVSTHLGVADITDSYEDAKRKLNALICWHVDVSHDPKVNGSAQQPAAEPVAWIYQNTNTDNEYLAWKKGTGGRNWRPLFTSPSAQETVVEVDYRGMYLKVRDELVDAQQRLDTCEALARSVMNDQVGRA